MNVSNYSVGIIPLGGVGESHIVIKCIMEMLDHNCINVDHV